MAKQISALNKQYESTWDSLHNNSELKPSSVRRLAIKLLSKHVLKPLPAINEELSHELLFDKIQERREAYAKGDEESYSNLNVASFFGTH